VLLRLLLALGLVLAVALLAARGADPSADVEIARCIRQLGSEKFEERDTATRRLDAIGERALPLLRQASEHDDVEVRRRSRDLVRIIEHRLFGERGVLTGHETEIVVVALSSNGRIGLSGANDHSMRVWDLDGGKELRRLDGELNGGWALAITPDGKRALGGDAVGRMYLWDIDTGKAVFCFEGRNGPVADVRFGPQHRLLSGGRDRTLRLWEAPP
jgi:WD40 repeat protein